MATAAAAAAPAPDYVDQIDNGVASVVSPAGEARTVALADLPPGVKEGHYVQGGQIVQAPPEAAAGNSLRAKLAAGDTGGTISLEQPAATVVSPVGQIPIDTPGLPAPTDDAAAAPGETGTAANPEAQKFIDATIAAPPIGSPPQAATESGVPPLGPDGLPASSEDLQKRLLAGTEGEKKALEGVGDAQAQGASDVLSARQAKDEIQRQQAADLAAQQQYERDRTAKLDAEDAANLAKARDTVIPEFWEGREGQLVGTAIIAGLSGAAGALLGTTHNAALEAITHNIDGYYTRARQQVDDRYKYAERQGMLNDKLRAQYVGELTDLGQQHAYTLQAAADRIQEVSDAAKGKVDQAQAKFLQAQLVTKSVGELQGFRKVDQENFDSETRRITAEAAKTKAQAAMDKVHKGKGGGGAAGGTGWLAAMQAAAQEPGATQASVMAAATDPALGAGRYRGKVNQLGTMAAREVANVGKQVGDVKTQMDDFEKQVNGTSGTAPGPGRQLTQLQAMNGELKSAMATGDPGQIKTSVTAITEEIGRMLSGGKTTKFTAGLLDNLKSVRDEFSEHLSRFAGDPAAGKHFVGNMNKLLSGVAAEKQRELNEIREKALQQTLGPGGSAASEAAKRHVMSRFSGIFNQKDESGKPLYEEGGAKPTSAIPAGAQKGKLPDGSKGYALGGKMFRMDGTPFAGK